MNRGEVSSSMRELAGRMQKRFPGLPVHHHIRAAASALDGDRPEGSIRHLNAAIASLAPLQLTRMGVHDDAGHTDAKRFMDQAHRHLLLVKDCQDAGVAS